VPPRRNMMAGRVEVGAQPHSTSIAHGPTPFLELRSLPSSRHRVGPEQKAATLI